MDVKKATTSTGFKLSVMTLAIMYGHEIEMYTVEQGEKRDKRQ